MDVFNDNLKSIEGTSLGDPDLLHEPSGEVCKDGSVRNGEEGKDMTGEVFLVAGEVFPLTLVLREVDFLGCPK